MASSPDAVRTTIPIDGNTHGKLPLAKPDLLLADCIRDEYRPAKGEEGPAADPDGEEPTPKLAPATSVSKIISVRARGLPARLFPYRAADPGGIGASALQATMRIRSAFRPALSLTHGLPLAS
jgi:hypothetical protein